MALMSASGSGLGARSPRARGVPCERGASRGNLRVRDGSARPSGPERRRPILTRRRPAMRRRAHPLARARALAGALALSLAIAPDCRAQEREPAAPPPSPGPPASSPLPAAEVIPPRLLGEAIVDYPTGAGGSADVVLELVIT